MRECAARRTTTARGSAKTSSQCYVALHRLGHAHSVEAWQGGALVGGLYGVHLGGAFFGESMFHRVTDASKVALVALVDRLRRRSFTLLDIQWVTPHLEQFGAVEIAANGLPATPGHRARGETAIRLKTTPGVVPKKMYERLPESFCFSAPCRARSA